MHRAAFVVLTTQTGLYQVAACVVSALDGEDEGNSLVTDHIDAVAAEVCQPHL